jgi:omega-amidase
MKDELIVALAQIDIEFGQPTSNVEVVEEMAADAARQGADVLVLPELWSTGYDLDRAAFLAHAMGVGIFVRLCDIGRRHRIAIVGSCLVQRDRNRITNTATYIDANGETVAAYDKTHLFRLMREHEYLSPGDRLTTFMTSWGVAGLAICYDLRFPELFRTYALAGASAVFVPAEWPASRCEHWRTLLRARAIENQMFVIACNRVGRDPDNLFCGHSCVIDPLGVTLVEGDQLPGLLIARLDLSAVSRARSAMPIFADRRPELYLDHSRAWG